MTARAIDAYGSGDLGEAQRLFLAAAQAGDIAAAYNAALIRLNEEADVPDEQTALALLERSAEGGFATAQHLLATLHEGGRYLPASQALASKWYRLAAEQGDADSQLSLATQYFLGRGTRQDYPEAARWYAKAAEAGDEGAQYILASMYERGLGVGQDLDEALAWYSAAARQGDTAAQFKAEEVVERLAAERRR
jgi:TPR repeat protein